MIEYPKINSIFKRDLKTGKFIEGIYSQPEFEYLKDNIWEWTEKVDGTNVRVIWSNGTVTFKGRTENAQMPVFLFSKLQEMFPPTKFETTFSGNEVTLYGEGFGARIQKGGGNYISNDVSFVLFDALIGKWWLQRKNILDVAQSFDIKAVPVMGYGTLDEAIQLIKKKELKSKWGYFLAEGIVLRPEVELKDRAGRRIITKLKHVDF